MVPAFLELFDPKARSYFVVGASYCCLSQAWRPSKADKWQSKVYGLGEQCGLGNVELIVEEDDFVHPYDNY